MAVIDQDLIAKASDERLKRLLGYVTADPGNAALITDAAEQALSVGEAAIAAELLGKDRDKLTERDLNLLGVAEMQQRNFSDAARTFASLIARGVEDPAIKFNLAWSLAMNKDFERALELLSNEVTAALPQAAMLHVQLLHDQGEFDGAAELARTYVELHPDHEGLAAAVSVLALDIEDEELARRSAERAGNHPDALATLGTLALGEQNSGEAVRLFDRALEGNQHVPRAWIGRGLARLLENDSEKATSDIDRGAELFGDHIGSWIAAGWAYLIAGKTAEARARFERALGIDDNFAESHGSLAVVDAIEGNDADARRRMAVATRLDRQCFSAAFAKTLMTARQGKPDAARAIFEKILQTPVNERGDTAAQALARMGLR
ncbi:MAG TPA: tetratricopeptide repeat protein [Sphingomicrobium sp.]|nr:tetratricopeptide repeat protein [Sphingomicrobium sp.]